MSANHDDHSRWMELNTAIHDKKLRNICFPSAHDAGTSNLQNIKTDDNGKDLAYYMGALNEIEDSIQSVVREIKGYIGQANGYIDEANKYIGYVDDSLKFPRLPELVIPPYSWLPVDIFGIIKGFSRTQSQTIKEQLEGGMRAFDLRIYYHEPSNDFYTYHGLLGEKISTILDDISDFLSSKPGEIVYASFTHNTHVDTPELKQRIMDMILEKLGTYAYRKPDGQISDSTLFEHTYNEIINQNTSGSKAIIVYEDHLDENPALKRPEVWSYKDCIERNMIEKYSESHNVDIMFEKQVTQFNEAKKKDLPFSLDLALTPNEADVKNILGTPVANRLREASNYANVKHLANKALGIVEKALNATNELPDFVKNEGHVKDCIKYVTDIRNIASMLVNKDIGDLFLGYLGVDPKQKLDWSTLEELSEKLLPAEKFSEMVKHDFTDSTGPNLVSMLCVDFYQKIDAVDLAIELSNQ